MKKLLLVIVAILALGGVLVLTKAEKKDVEMPEPVDLPRGEIPVSRQAEDKSAHDADYEFWDTLIMIGDKAFGQGFITREGIQKSALLYDTTALTVDPTVTFSAQSPNSFTLDMIGRKGRFDASSPTCLDELRAFFEPINGYLRYQKDYYQMGYVAHADTTLPLLKYLFVLDYPDTADTRNGDILPWLASLVERSQTMDEPLTTNVAGYHPADSVKYAGKVLSGKSLGDSEAKRFFDGMSEDLSENTPWGYEMTVDLRARVSNDRYVTYRSFVHSHEATTHGMYAEYLHTYDRKNKREVDYDYLFKPGTLAPVHRLLYEAMAADTTFVKAHSLEATAEAVERWANHPSAEPEAEVVGLSHPLPKPALTDEGIVFSFQPYEIGCFADGAFHFTIPYAKATPYLTSRARATIAI